MSRVEDVSGSCVQYSRSPFMSVTKIHSWNSSFSTHHSSSTKLIWSCQRIQHHSIYSSQYAYFGQNKRLFFTSALSTLSTLESGLGHIKTMASHSFTSPTQTSLHCHKLVSLCHNVHAKKRFISSLVYSCSANPRKIWNAISTIPDRHILHIFRQ